MRQSSGVILLLLAGVLSLREGFGQGGAQVASNEPLPYIRVVRPDTNTVELQVAARRFVPAQGTGPVVWLTGVSHIGESNYFQTLQQHLDRQGLVLFEGVREGPAPAELGASGVPQAQEGSLQVTLADSLGLAFQLQAINYRRAHFRNSDLSVQELQERLAEGPGDAAASGAGAELAALFQIMDGSSFLGAVVQAGVRLLGSSAKLRALTRLVLVETIGQLEGDLSRLQGLPAETKRLLEVLIRARNQAVVRDLAAALKKSKPSPSISVFYGAAHMPDLEQRLRRELHYRPTSDLWLTAIAVNPARSGLTGAEIALVQSLVRMQLETLQKAPAK